jgi:cysteine desulfurase family protein (TIGR01976 family)
MANLDLKWIREQFPALTQTVNNQPAIFLDGPGGTQVPQAVIDAISDYLMRSNANCHGAFATSERTDMLLHEGHRAIADLLGCAPQEIVFGQNMTTLTFMLSRSIGRTLQPGDEIIVTRLDHSANVSPWRALEERGAVIRTVDIHEADCTLNLADLEQQLSDRTRLVAVGYASNAVGTINDVAAVTRMAHQAGALVFVDAVHYAPHGPMDVRALDCDFLACSVYKFFGPHLGVLYGKQSLLEQLQPYKVRPASDQIPDRWETGTQNHEGIAGAAAAVEYLAQVGRSPSEESAEQSPSTANQTRRAALQTAMNVIQSYEQELSRLLIPGLLSIPGIQVYGITDSNQFHLRTPTVGIRLKGYSPRSVAEQLGDRGIFAWNGNFYAPDLTERLGIEDSGGLVRLGLVHYNTADEVHRLLNVLESLVAPVMVMR